MALSVSTSPELSTLKFSDQGTLILSSSETRRGNSAINNYDVFQIFPTQALSNVRVSVDSYGGFWSRTYINATPDWNGGTPLYVSAISGQTGDLTKWSNSAGTTLARVASNGVMKANVGMLVENSTLANYTALQVNSTITNGTGVVVQGAASQTANLQEWQDSAGTVLAKVTSGGSFTSYNTNFFGRTFFLQDGSTNASTQASGAYFAASSANSAIYARTTSASIVPLVVQGTTSQTADLQQWQDSVGNIYAKINTYGQLAIGDSNPSIYSNARISLNTVSASAVGQVIRGVASQTANLQEWQDNSGNNLGTMSAYGTFTAQNRMYAGWAAFGSGFGTLASASNVVLIAKGSASQTADLQQWQNNSGTVLAKVDASGNFSAISKSFDISHPTKENMRLRYASLEGPENGVYIRGTTESNIIELPEYWTGLVHEDSITVSLTAVGSAQNIYVEKIENNKVYIGGELTKVFFTVYGERKDIDNLTVEY
jgi:hypothetical protein